MDCIFCQVVAGAIPATKLYEDASVVVINDIHPKAKVHVLVIPKQHLVTFNDVTAEFEPLLGKMAAAVGIVTKQLGINESGYKVVVNNGPDGGQAVPHLHWHVLGGEPVHTVTGL